MSGSGCYEYFTADWADDEAPAELNVYVDGEQTELVLTWGQAHEGVYSIERPSDDWGFGCHEYFVQYETADGHQGTFPEQGSYLYGDTCDNTLMWVDSQQGWEPD